MKLINKIRNIILLIVVVLMMVPSSIVNGLSNTITTGNSTTTLKYIGYSGNETKFKIKKLSDGSLVYCMNHNLDTPESGLTYKKKVDVTDQYPGIIYILQNGYPNKKKASESDYLTGINDYDYYITQGAIHWYIDRVNGIPDTAAKGTYSNQQLGSGFKISAPVNVDKEFAMREKIQSLVEDAIEATENTTYDASPKITLTNSNRYMSADEAGENWVSKKFTVTTKNNVGSTYNVELIGAPEGTSVYDVSGNKKTTFSISEGFIVKTPNENVTAESVNFTVKVSTTGTIIKAYQYTTTEKNENGNTPQDIAVIDTESTTPNSTYTLKIANNPIKVKLAKVNTNGDYVANAKLRYYDKDTNANPVDFTTTTDATEVEFMAGDYCLKEIAQPSGYIKNSSEVCFTVNINGNVYNYGSDEPLESPVVIKITNDINEININKVDEKGLSLTGAKLALYKVKSSSNDEEDTTSVQIGDDWVSSTTAKNFSQLAPGWYLIVEKETPKGYVSTNPVYFRVRDDGKIVDGSTSKVITSINVKNAKTVTNIHKTDITGTNEIPGAYLRVLDSAGNVVGEPWISTDKPHEISYLGAGLTYRLEETIAPPGYALTSFIEFTVNEDGSVTEVTMKNDVIRLIISKQDITNGKELSGAHLVIRKENGDIYTDWDSSDEEKVIEMIPAGKYTLEETTSPDGYMLNTEIITFIVKEDGTITDADGNPIDKVIMYNTPETPVPKTAANISVFVYLIGIIAISGGAYLLYNKKKLNK